MKTVIEELTKAEQGVRLLIADLRSAHHKVCDLPEEQVIIRQLVSSQTIKLIQQSCELKDNIRSLCIDLNIPV